MRAYPLPEKWEHANEQQAQRAARSFAELQKRDVPVYGGPLFVDDDRSAKIQSPDEVARRTLALWAVALRADGIPQAEAFELTECLNLQAAVSPKERRFLQSLSPDPEECQQFVWRLESIWVLLWSLGYIEKLDWPSGMCDVPRLTEILRRHERNREFIATAKLRPTSEILDAYDLIMRIHWAIRDAYLNQGGLIPQGPDWSQKCEWIPVSMSPAAGVVQERHYTLSWLVNFMNPKDWDHVDTST